MTSPHSKGKNARKAPASCYRILKVGEKIKYGDEALDPRYTDKSWFKLQMISNIVIQERDTWTYRRPTRKKTHSSASDVKDPIL